MYWINSCTGILLYTIPNVSHLAIRPLFAKNEELNLSLDHFNFSATTSSIVSPPAFSSTLSLSHVSKQMSKEKRTSPGTQNAFLKEISLRARMLRIHTTRSCHVLLTSYYKPASYTPSHHRVFPSLSATPSDYSI